MYDVRFAEEHEIEIENTLQLCSFDYPKSKLRKKLGGHEPNL